MNVSLTILIATLGLASQLALAQAAEQTQQSRQEIGALKQTVEQFLKKQAIGLPGDIQVEVGSVDPRMKLPACPQLQAFLPRGSKAWGKTTVGVRCTAPMTWTVYISATVGVRSEYVVATVPLAQGQTIGEGDIVKVKGDLTTMPPGIITEPSQAVGRTVTSSVSVGAPLRQDALRNQQAIQQGQAVRVVLNGAGFSVTSEARALNNANEGQLTQVRTQAGQVVSGIAKLGGIVELTY
jgi:flagellar basal body P-ring formation protein FlgA